MRGVQQYKDFFWGAARLGCVGGQPFGWKRHSDVYIWLFMKQAIVLFSALLFFAVCRGQEGAVGREGSVVLLRGRIVSAGTGEAIGYATIGLARNGIETMSNEEGRFTFKIPAADAGDSIFVSHIGYQSVVLLINGQDTGVTMIALKEKPVELPGVTVTPVSAVDIIHRAMDKIPDNYPAEPYTSYGFYRFASWHDSKIIYLSEAIFDIYCPDNDRANKQFRLIKARMDRDEEVFKGSGWTMGRNPNGLMDDDLVSRIHETEVLGDEGMQQHNYIVKGLIDYEGRPAYEIRFDQKDGVADAGYKGRIIVDAQSLAFVRIEYELSPKGAAYWKPNRGGGLTRGLSMIITYRKYGGKYYLNHVSRDARWRIEALHDFEVDNKSIYLVTRIDTGQLNSDLNDLKGKLIRNNEAIEVNAKRNSPRQDNYWENYNSIEADFNVDSVLRVMRHGN
jgi:CarboxypepD_reg-like domain